MRKTVRKKRGRKKSEPERKKRERKGDRKRLIEGNINSIFV